MEQNESPTQTTESSASADVSVGTLITNVFASPREAFDALAGAEVKHMRWVLPLLITLVVMVIGIYLITSNATFHQQMQDAQMSAMQKQVDEGKMTQEQADRAADMMGSGGKMFLIIGSIGGSIFVLLMFVVGALFLWLAGKFVLKSPAGYPKYLEVYGLSAWVGIGGAIITFMLMIGMNTMYASASGALVVLSDFDPSNTTHKLLKALDVFAIWQAVVVGIGLSAVAKKENGPGIGVALGLWVLWVAVSVGLGFGR